MKVSSLTILGEKQKKSACFSNISKCCEYVRYHWRRQHGDAALQFTLSECTKMLRSVSYPVFFPPFSCFKAVFPHCFILRLYFSLITPLCSSLFCFEFNSHCTLFSSTLWCCNREKYNATLHPNLLHLSLHVSTQEPPSLTSLLTRHRPSRLPLFFSPSPSTPPPSFFFPWS